MDDLQTLMFCEEVGTTLCRISTDSFYGRMMERKEGGTTDGGSMTKQGGLVEIFSFLYNIFVCFSFWWYILFFADILFFNAYTPLLFLVFFSILLSCNTVFMAFCSY